jgi:hypothetical protein
MQIPEMDRAHMAGNHVLLCCPEADLRIGHFPVRGDRLGSP